MSANEGLVPLPANSGQVPVDPNVRIPDHVQQSASAADALHARLYAAPADPAAEEAARAAAAAAAAPEIVPAVVPAAPAQEQVQPAAGDDFTGPADNKALGDSEWARRYNSMRGRFEAQVRSNGAMEQQMRELGQELLRTQQMLATVQSSPVPADNRPARGPDHGNVITDADREGYGDELIDLARRAARDAMGPEMDALRADNATLTNRIKSTAKRELFQEMDRALPTWRQINKDQRFLGWLRLPNIYTGQVRGNMLKAAVDGGNAPQALQLFRDFLLEAQATGMIAPAAPTEQQAPQQAAPHVPAIDLNALAAPGRAKPSSGDSQVPAAKPNYSRADIAKFYEDSRKGLYAGRDAEYRAIEADLSAAQREGRIR